MAAGAGQCVPTMSYTNQKAMYDGVKKSEQETAGGSSDFFFTSWAAADSSPWRLLLSDLGGSY